MSPSIRLLRQHVGGQRAVLGVAILSTGLLAAAELARPFPLKIVIDTLLVDAGTPFTLDGGGLALLAGVAGLVLLIAAVEAVASYQMEIRLRRAGESIAHSLRVAVYAHLQRLSLSFHEGRQQGDLVTRATGDVNMVGQLFSDSLGALTSSALLLIGMLIVSLLIDPILALAAFSVAPFLALLTFLTRGRVKAAAKQQRTKEGEIASLATEALSAMRAVKALGSEHFERDRLARASEERQVAGLQAAQIEGRFAGVVDVLGAVSVAVVLVVGVIRVAAGAISPGDVVVMTSYARKIHRPLRDLARETNRIARALVRAERVAEILGNDDVLPEPPHPHRGPRARGELEMDNVTFSYSTERPVLHDLSLRIPAGQKIALSGPSGAGKSTVAGLLARFYDPQAGRVLLDGRDLRVCSVSWLRAQVGLVLQETILFTGTVAENIAYGTNAETRDIVRAARAAGAHAFIVDLPDGYDTLLGSRGVALSGGQRQRMAIARTLLRDPPVLVLDEPTAALDARSEAEVIAGLETLMAGRTTVMITHSQRLVRWADRVVAIEDGRLVRDGPTEDGPAVTPAPPVVHEPPSDRARQATPVPADPALPQLGRLLDPTEMARAFGRSLADGATSPDVAIRYLRYKPGTNLVVQYAVTVGGKRHDATATITSDGIAERRATKPKNLALAALVDGRAPTPTPLVFDPAVPCLIQWYPLDISLPGLAQPSTLLRRRLSANGVPVAAHGPEPTSLAYKPRRRAVLRFDQHVLKCYADERAFAAATRALDASQKLRSVTAPSLEGSLSDILVTVQPLLPGHAPEGPADVAREAGRLLANLHASDAAGPTLAGLPVARPEDQLDGAAASARLVATIVPSLGRRLDRLVGNLERSVPAGLKLVPSHGDFNSRQLLVAGVSLLLTDLDELCLAPRALDPATYAAYVLSGDGADLAAVERVLDDLLSGYGRRPDAMSWYLASMILRRAPRPFRYFEPEWPERVAGMVDAAEQTLGW